MTDLTIDLDLIASTSCPACRARKARAQLACRSCWGRIPLAHRRDVNAALAAWYDEPDTDEDAGRLGALRAAQSRALGTLIHGR